MSQFWNTLVRKNFYLLKRILVLIPLKEKYKEECHRMRLYPNFLHRRLEGSVVLDLSRLLEICHLPEDRDISKQPAPETHAHAIIIISHLFNWIKFNKRYLSSREKMVCWHILASLEQLIISELCCLIPTCLKKVMGFWPMAWQSPIFALITSVKGFFTPCMRGETWEITLHMSYSMES